MNDTTRVLRALEARRVGIDTVQMNASRHANRFHMFDTEGSGELKLPDVIDFEGTGFVDEPGFTAGAVLQPGEVLVDGAFPLVTCGVYEWVTVENYADDKIYTGAKVYLHVSGADYKLRHTLCFHGIAIKGWGFQAGMT